MHRTPVCIDFGVFPSLPSSTSLLYVKSCQVTVLVAGFLMLEVLSLRVIMAGSTALRVSGGGYLLPLTPLTF